MKDFKEWAYNNDINFPVPKQDFHKLMCEFAIDSPGRLGSGKIGIMDNKLVMIRFGFMF